MSWRAETIMTFYLNMPHIIVNDNIKWDDQTNSNKLEFHRTHTCTLCTLTTVSGLLYRELTQYWNFSALTHWGWLFLRYHNLAYQAIQWTRQSPKLARFFTVMFQKIPRDPWGMIMWIETREIALSVRLNRSSKHLWRQNITGDI